jgi:hypothetical protein
MRIAAVGAWISFFIYFFVPPLLLASLLHQNEGMQAVLLRLGGAYFLAAAFVLHLVVSGYAALWTHLFLHWLLPGKETANRPITRDDAQL